MPEELKGIAKRILDLCQQGKLSLLSQNVASDEFELETTGICFKAGYSLGNSIAMEDPIAAIWAIYSGVAEYSKATSKHNQKIKSIYLQYEYRLNSDKYDLRNSITENASKYGINSDQIITFDVLEEFEKVLPEIYKNPSVIYQYIEKYPYYDKFKCHAINIQAGNNYLDLLPSIILNKNSILLVDNNKLNMCAKLLQDYTLSLLVGDKTEVALKLMPILIEYGLKNGGHSSPVFYFYRGVVNSYAQYYKLTKMSEDSIFSDLTMNKPLDNGEFMRYQSLWLACYISKFCNDDSSKRLLTIYIKAALQHWSPTTVMNVNIFNRTTDAQNVYKKIMEKKWKVRIVWGWFDDDIVLENNSQISLSNVKLNVTIYDKLSNQTIKKELKCDLIEAGKTHKWVDIISIPNGNDDNVTINATLSCDEDNI